jgi:hypothetical protein
MHINSALLMRAYPRLPFRKNIRIQRRDNRALPHSTAGKLIVLKRAYMPARFLQYQ